MTKHPPVHHPKNLILGFHGWDESVPRGQLHGWFPKETFCNPKIGYIHFWMSLIREVVGFV
jgi:hypothetical protein